MRRPALFLITLIVVFTITELRRSTGEAVLPIAFAAGSIVVTSTNDSGPGSLRQAILDANDNPGSDLITFSIASGPQVITPTSLLPDITDPVVIDGTSQPGFAGVPLVEVSGINVPDVLNAGLLTIKAGDTTVRGLIVNHCKNFGISIMTGGGNHVEGNYLGTDATGNLPTDSQGNLITIDDSPNNVIGGITPAARNVISGSGLNGISIFGSNAKGNLIQGNYIGTNAAGTAALSNFNSGIFLGSSNNLVGGASAEARNLISGNRPYGILIQTADASSNVILGNYIGTDVSGNVDLGNSVGIGLFNSSHNAIGISSVGGGNVISGNDFEGLLIEGSDATGNIVQNNYVGIGADGKTPLGNSEDGIRLGTASNTTVGGSSPETGNTIAFNGGGIRVFLGTGNFILGNSIFSNASNAFPGDFFGFLPPSGMGIDLNANGVTANDLGDSDTGANNLQNFPVISSVQAETNQTTITGSLNSLPNTTFRIHFYANSACGRLGHGEGATPFGSGATFVTTNSSGDALFTVMMPGSLPDGKAITATATDPAGNTSEFSACDGAMTGGKVEFSARAIRVMEDIGVVTMEVDRNGGSRGSLSVKYSTADITATAGQDYLATSGTITFSEGETVKTFDIPIGDDAFVENDEAFAVRLSDTVNIDSLGNPTEVVITLQDNHVPPVLTIENASRNEGNSGTADSFFLVSFSPPTGRPVKVDYSTKGLTATSGVDFQPVSGTLSFGPSNGEVIVVPIIGDRLDEFDETFNVVLSNPVGATIDGGPAVGTIRDDDPSPLVSISNVSVPEGNGSELTSAQFVLTLDAPSGKVPCVQASTSDGTATAGSDYVPFGTGSTNPPALVFFEAGATSATLTVNVIPDHDNEPNETFLVQLAPCPGEVSLVFGQLRAVGTILNDDPPRTIQFSDPTYSVNEGTPDVVVSVNRTGNASAAATVGYATSDTSGANKCVFATTSASERCDYRATSGTLQFAPNETSKVISIPIIDDGYLEGNETFTISLTNPTGAALGDQPLASIRIIDNESASRLNPIEQANFFVRQHYLDFLNREPDQGGWDFWTNQITSCGTNGSCTEGRRVDVSASFFLSIEFQQTGYLVERFYKVAYGDATGTSTFNGVHPLTVPIVRLTEFLGDTQRIGQGVVVLAPGWEQVLENNKQAYAGEFVQTTRFITAFPPSMTPDQFVDQLNQRAGNVLSPGERTTAINLFAGAANSSNTTARARAVRQVADDTDLYNAEFNRAFVLAQYFGYLRRNPNDPQDADYTGYDFWLTKLNQFNGNYINAEMVKAFLSSIEYRQRFGP